MRLLIRLVALVAAWSVLGTVWFIVIFAGRGGVSFAFLQRPLGVLTVVGWLITLGAGPVAAVQLWRLRASGRVPGLLLFGYGFAFYAVGLVWLRAPEASVPMILLGMATFALPIGVLLSRRAQSALR